MKIKGPNGNTPIGEIDPIGEVDSVGNVEAPESVEAPAAAQGTGAADAVTQVAAQLRAGQITVDQAVDRLIDDAIERQLGHQAPADLAALAPKLRELLRSYAESDP